MGAWRTREAGATVDADGRDDRRRRRAAGVVELRAALLKHPDVFVGTLTEKLMIYALGRGLQAYDMPVVRGIVRDAGRAATTASRRWCWAS